MWGLVCLGRIAAFVLLLGRHCACGSSQAYMADATENCAAMTAAHRRFPFGTQLRVCHSGCVTVRINDRGPWVRGRDIDLSPAAAQAIGLYKTSRVTMSASVNAGVTPD